MAVDFFEREDNARRQTVRLLVMFALCVAVIILLVYLVAVIALAWVPNPGGREPWFAGERLEPGALPGRCPGHDRGSLVGQPLQDCGAVGRR